MSQDDAWEDDPSDNGSVKIEEFESVLLVSSPTGSLSSRKRLIRGRIVGSPSPRKSRTKKTIASQSQAEISYPVQSPAPQTLTDAPPIITYESASNGLKQFLVFAFHYVLDVSRMAISLLKRPLALFVFFYAFVYLMSQMSSVLRAAFSPICWIPGISSTPLCWTMADKSHGIGLPQQADYPRLMEAQSETFEKLLDDAVSGSGLSLEIKKGEMAAGDLAALVRFSDLASKDTLSTSLRDFVKDASNTGKGLRRLSSKIGGSVDNIMAINDYAFSTIQRVDQSSTLDIVPWYRKSKEAKVIAAFTASMDTMNAELKRLIIEAEFNLVNLNNLEEKLNSIHEIVSREENVVSEAKADLLSFIWTQLGGNKKEMRGFESNLALLKNLAVYRQKARVHVVGALQTLHGMQEDMEDLRERVAAPELAGKTIPIEVHMKAIRKGIERLKDGRIEAKKREEESFRRILDG